MRAALTIGFCAGALLIGVLTARLTAKNRARAHALDRRQHWCDTFSRGNELLRSLNAAEEWHLLNEPVGPPEAEPEVEVEN